MKRLLLLAAVLTAPAALAQQQLFYKSETQTLSASAPTLASDGVAVDAAQGVFVTLVAPTSQTVTGGAMQGYAYVCETSNAAGGCLTKVWTRYAAADWTPVTGIRAPTSGDFEVLGGVFRLAWRTASVTLSSGSSVTVTYTVRNRK